MKNLPQGVSSLPAWKFNSASSCSDAVCHLIGVSLPAPPPPPPLPLGEHEESPRATCSRQNKANWRTDSENIDITRRLISSPRLYSRHIPSKSDRIIAPVPNRIFRFPNREKFIICRDSIIPTSPRSDTDDHWLLTHLQLNENFRLTAHVNARLNIEDCTQASSIGSKVEQ